MFKKLKKKNEVQLMNPVLPEHYNRIIAISMS